MKRFNLCNLDYSASWLSPLDISGSSLLKDNLLGSAGMSDDLLRLSRDLETLEGDYENACKRVAKDQPDDYLRPGEEQSWVS